VAATKIDHRSRTTARTVRQHSTQFDIFDDLLHPADGMSGHRWLPRVVFVRGMACHQVRQPVPDTVKTLCKAALSHIQAWPRLWSPVSSFDSQRSGGYHRHCSLISVSGCFNERGLESGFSPVGCPIVFPDMEILATTARKLDEGSGPSLSDRRRQYTKA